ncbi:hypothetical protein GCM10010096_22370 [Alcaligenes pakistanensis]|uniref:Uncharacterized protein n=1 Tax=Alcaligenes pakistanensis TaxID=1482717 RepID=A0A8H9M901_9BURK|nr:hypothetical protein GCM10010096_22370 [Alcaligenes pakistanensis]
MHIQGAARQIDQGTWARHHMRTTELHGAALRGPFTDAVAGYPQITAHFQKPPCGVPAVFVVAICACRHKYQITAIQPDVTAAQIVAFAVNGCIALLIALDIYQNIIGFHRHSHTDVARHVNDSIFAYVTALASIHKDLAAGGQRQAVCIENNIATTANLHQ